MLKSLILTVFLVNSIYSEIVSESPSAQNVNTEGNNSRITEVNKIFKAYEKLTVDLMDVPSVKQGENVFKEMCDRNGGNDSFTNAMDAVRNIKQCFSEIISYAELPAKIEKSRPHGELDTVFKEYCMRTDQMKGCINTLLVQIDPCLAETQKSSKYTVQNISEAILRFVCEEEGEHIALFISEKGLECILSKQAGIKRCIQEKMPDNRTDDFFDERNITDVENFNFTSEQEQIFSLAFELEHCRKAYQVRKCIVNELVTCNGSTPANVIDSVFTLIHNSTTCSKFRLQDIDPGYSSAESLFINSMFSVIVPALTILLVRTFNS